MIEIKGKKHRNLQEQVLKNMEDIEELKNAGQVEYSAGTGIDIEDGVISVDSDVAMKTDLPTKTSDLDNDSGFVTSSDVHTYTAGTGIDITSDVIAVDNTVAMKTDIPSYTAGTGISLTGGVVAVDNTVAMKTDIPTYTGGSGISISGTTIAADNTIARVADIPTLSGLTVYNYKITITGYDSGTGTARSAVYIMSVPYQFNYSSLSIYEIIHLIPVWSVVTDTDTAAGNKKMGRFHWQTATIAQVDWIDGTFTYMDFTGSYFNATVEAAAPAHW